MSSSSTAASGRSRHTGCGTPGTSSTSSPSSTLTTRNDPFGDAEWIADGCQRGWVLLTKDRRIRYRTDELAALTDGHLFCLTDGNATLDVIAQRFLEAMPAIHRAVQRTKVGFWHVHADGRVTKMWP